MNTDDNSFSRSGQALAQRWLAGWLRHPAKASDIRSSGACGGADRDEWRRALRLFTDVLRHLRLYRYVLDPHIDRPPPTPTLAVLLLALAEINASEDSPAPVVDSWVRFLRRRGGPRPAGFVNAVLRKAAKDPVLQGAHTDPIPPGILHSHPDWLVERWRQLHGSGETERLLLWNQKPADVFVHLASGRERPPPGLAESRWPGFFRMEKGFGREILESIETGRLTVRDPATRIAVEGVLADRPETVLDLCSSPGGKARAMLTATHGPASVVAGDLAERIDLLAENLRPWRNRTVVQAVDLESGEGTPASWAGCFRAVLIDAPCTNTGVIRRKPDVKWRLTPGDIAAMPPRQSRLLERASNFVAPGGILVYSTCSLEPEENRHVVEAFLSGPAGRFFSLETAVHALPWKTGHDGAGVFRLRKID